VGGAGGAVGVLLGGVLTEWIDWRAIFFVNVPIGALLAVGVSRTVRPDAEPARWQGLDLRGALVATASLAALLYALAGADDAGWLAPRTLGIGVAALAGLGVFAALERRTARPLLHVERLADRAVGGGWALMLLASAVLMGTFLLVSVYLQEVLGASALETGLGLLPAAVAAGAGAHVGGHLVQRHGVRGPMALAFALATTGMLLLSGAGAGGDYVADVLPGLIVGVAGLGIAMVAVAVAVLTGARDEETGMLSGLNTTGHEVGGALGVAALTTIAARAIGAGVPGREALATGLGDAFLAGAGLAAAGLVLALVVLPRAATFLPRLRAAPAPVSMH
jgi:predicted MFS family arabinose efflux permease